MLGISEFEQVYNINKGLRIVSYLVPTSESQRKVNLLTAKGQYTRDDTKYDEDVIRIGRVDTRTGERVSFLPEKVNFTIPADSLLANFSVTKLRRGEVSRINNQFIDLWIPKKDFNRYRRRIS